MSELPEVVAFVTLLDDRKRGLLPLLVPRWNAIDIGGRERIWVAVCNDASDEHCDEFTRLVMEAPDCLGVVFARETDLEAKAPPLHPEDSGDGLDPYVNIAFLHKMAVLRDAARVAVLKAEAEPAPAWVFWIDQDVDPRSHAFTLLHADLTETVGPLAPLVVCGIYATRWIGDDMSQWMDAGEEPRYVPLLPGMVQQSRVAGFGCVLMRRDVLEVLTWQPYTTYRDLRAKAILSGTGGTGALGEDCFWFRQYEFWHGQAPMVDNRVRCRHYQTDGSYWLYEEAEVNGNPRLVPRLCTDELIEGARIELRNAGPARWSVPRCNIDVEPGGTLQTSTDIAELLRVICQGVEEVPA